MTDLTPWNNPRSYLPNLEDQLGIVEHYEKLARQAKRSGRFGFANRATREPSRVSPSRPLSTIAWGDMLFGAACGILFGMSATVGLAYVWSLFL